MSEQDLYYLKSILSQLRELRKFVSSQEQVAMLGGEVLADNIDWLDCFIDKHERKKSK